MRREIDYRTYDPQQFVSDHPGDAVVEHAKERSQTLQDTIGRARLGDTPQEQRHHIDQSFDILQGDIWNKTDLLNKEEQHKEFLDYKTQLRQEVQREANQTVSKIRNPEAQRAATLHIPGELKRIDELTVTDARKQDSTFDDKMEQLTHYQAARSEAASNEIEKVREGVLKERNLERDNGSGPPSSPPAAPAPIDKTDAEAEKRARIREALSRRSPDSSGKSQNRDHTPDSD